MTCEGGFFNRLSSYEYRKELFEITPADIQALKRVRPAIEKAIDSLVDQFYQSQTNIPEIALLIGDAETLNRLRNAQRTYVLDLFSGFYDAEYVNNRLRIGLVHKRIGVGPKLYLTAVNTLKHLLAELLHTILAESEDRQLVIFAVEKLFMFDISLVFETYIRSLIAEIEMSKEKSEQYASMLEEKVKERTLQLEILSRLDPLTGLLNIRHLSEILTKSLRRAQRRSEAITVVYMDINKFKRVNDTFGHQRGDEILKTVAQAIKKVSRLEDQCFRYGGDEFCVVMAGCTAEQAENTYGDRLFKEIYKQEPTLGLSVGYAQTGPEEYVSAEELIHQADAQMYAVKKTSKDSSP